MSAAPKRRPRAPKALPAPATPAAAVDGAMDAEAAAQAEAQWLVSLGQDVYVDLDRPVEALLDSASANLNAAATRTAVAGLELLAAKARVPHGAFMALVEARGIQQDTAENAMRIARWLSRIPKSDARRMLRATPTHLREIARLDPAELAALEAEGGTDTEGLMALPTRDLAAMVRKHRREARDARAALLDAQAAAAEPQGKAAWNLAADRCHADVAQLAGEIHARLVRLGEAVERFGAAPPAGHARSRRRWTGAIRQIVTEVEGALARERAERIDPALERVGGSG